MNTLMKGLNPLPETLITTMEMGHRNLDKIRARQAEIPRLLAVYEHDVKYMVLEHLIEPLVLEGKSEDFEMVTESSHVSDPVVDRYKDGKSGMSSQTRKNEPKKLLPRSKSGIFSKEGARRVVEQQRRPMIGGTGQKRGGKIEAWDDEEALIGRKRRQSTGDNIDVRPPTPRQVPVSDIAKDSAPLSRPSSNLTESVRDGRAAFLSRLTAGTVPMLDTVGSAPDASAMAPDIEPPPADLIEQDVEMSERIDSRPPSPVEHDNGNQIFRAGSPAVASPAPSDASSDGLFVTDRRERESPVMSHSSRRSGWSVEPAPSPELVQTQFTGGEAPSALEIDGGSQDIESAVRIASEWQPREAFPAVGQPNSRSVLLFGGEEGALSEEVRRGRSGGEEDVDHALGAFIEKKAPKDHASDGPQSTEPHRSTPKSKAKGKSAGKFSLSELSRKGGWGKRPQ